MEILIFFNPRSLGFGYVFKRIMSRAIGRINEEFGLETPDFRGHFDLTAPPPRDRDLPDLVEIVWADDLAVAYRCQDAAVLCKHIARITAIIFQENLRHALIPNLKAGKTEIQLILKGKNSKATKAAVFNSSEPYLEIEEVPADFGQVRIVPSYRHLGTRIDVSTRHRIDVKARMGQANAAFRKYRKAIFQNRLLGLTKRLFLFRSLVLSVLSYNIGTWGRLLVSEMNYFRSKLYSMYRSLVRCDVPELDLRLWNNDRVLAYLGMPSAEVIIASARLRYSMTLYNSAPAAVWHLLAAEEGWLEQLRLDQDWMRDQLKGYGPRPSWDPNFHDWCNNSTRSFKPWIGKAVEHDVLQKKKEVEWREWHFLFLQACIHAGLDMDLPDPIREDLGNYGGLEACLSCHRIFKNRAAWAVHAFKCHGRINKTREVIDGTRCHSCGKEYFTTARLQHHLSYKEECFRHYVQAGRRSDNILPGMGNLKELKDRRLKLPVLRSYGPKEQRFDAPVQPADDDFDFPLFETFMDYYEAEDPEAPIEQLVEGVKQCCAGSSLSFAEVKKTLKYFADLVEQDDLGEQCRMAPIKVMQSAQIAWRRCSLPWFFEKSELKADPTDESIRSAAWLFCKTYAGVKRWRQGDYIPRVRSRGLVFLHLYSGHRRTGDLHEALSGLRAPSGYYISVISVDIIYDAKAGNLADEANQKTWILWIRSGIVAGVFAGPPCETWSRARLKGGVPTYTYGDGGPRLLRDRNSPQGLPHLKVKEVQQVIVANKLLCFAIMVFLCVLENHLFMVLEHPGEPPVETEWWLASIWRLFLTAVLDSNANVQTVTIYQGHYGCKSPKPTNLMACVGPGICVSSVLQSWQTCQDLPAQLDMGWDKSKKEFSTAALKSYPPDLCTALSRLAQHWLDCHSPAFASPVDLPQSFVQFTDKLMKAFNQSVARGADYHG